MPEVDLQSRGPSAWFALEGPDLYLMTLLTIHNATLILKSVLV